MTLLTLATKLAASDAKLASAIAMSTPESVGVADKSKRAISERISVIRPPSRSKETQLVFVGCMERGIIQRPKSRVVVVKGVSKKQTTNSVEQ